MACVVSKLMYCLESLWLLQADRHRLDAFHAKCLRRIPNIPCSYISRISNENVLNLARQSRVSVLLEHRQNALYHKIAASHENDILRRLTLRPASIFPKTWTSTRRRGRPKLQWAPCVYKRLNPSALTSYLMFCVSPADAPAQALCLSLTHSLV